MATRRNRRNALLLLKDGLAKHRFWRRLKPSKFRVYATLLAHAQSPLPPRPAGAFRGYQLPVLPVKAHRWTKEEAALGMDQLEILEISRTKLAKVLFARTRMDRAALDLQNFPNSSSR